MCPSRPLTKYRNAPEKEAQGGEDGGDMPGGGGKVPNCPRKVSAAIFTYPPPQQQTHVFDGLREGGGMDWVKTKGVLEPSYWGGVIRAWVSSSLDPVSLPKVPCRSGYFVQDRCLTPCDIPSNSALLLHHRDSSRYPQNEGPWVPGPHHTKPLRGQAYFSKWILLKHIE